MSGLTVHRFASVDEVNAFGGPRLLANEAKNSLVLGILHRLANVRDANATFFGVGDRRSARAVAVRTPPYFLVLDDCDAEAATALAESMTDPLPGVVGSLAGAEAFARAHTAHSGLRARPMMVQGLYELTTLIPGPAHPGEARLATRDDVALVTDWIGRFCDDCGLPANERDSAQRAAPDRIEGGTIVLLWVDGAPVAMAGRAGTTPNVARLSYVFTPREHRGHGHASAIVEHLTRQLLTEKRSVCLTTDMANSTSNGLYLRLGYEKIGEATMIAFG